MKISEIEKTLIEKEPLLYVDIYGYDTKKKTLSLEIAWGDWKHDHARLDYFMRTQFPCKKVDEFTTEEDGSDTYSGVHVYYFPNGIEVA